MHPELLLTNIGYILSIILTVVLAFFILLKGRRKLEHITFFLLSMVLAGYEVSHVVGINLTDPELSRQVFMFNTINLFIVALSAHWVFAMMKITRQQWWPLTIIYAISTGMFIGYFIWPETFMLASNTNVMYFNSYYNIGPLYPVMTAYFVLVIFYFMYHLFRVYLTTGNEMLKARLKYIIVGLFWGYGVGMTPLLPLYGIDFDPIISTLLATYTIPFAYSIVAHNLWDLNLLAKRAFWYAVLVAFLALLIAGVNALNNVILELYPTLSLWVIPVASAVLAVAIGAFVWNRLRLVDTLRYELLQVVMHKFRTPLTRIRWATEQVGGQISDERGKKSISQIKSATNVIGELVDVLVYSSTIDTAQYRYTPSKLTVHAFIESALSSFNNREEKRDFQVHENGFGNVELSIDERRLSFALQVLVDNAFKYTKEGGTVLVSVGYDEKRKQIRFVVVDNGIGFSEANKHKIFYEFYRAKNARQVDTEGMGLGLFLSKKIVEKHGGALLGESAGEGYGSTFTLVLPAEGDTIDTQ